MTHLTVRALPPVIIPLPPVMTTEEVAELLRCPVKTVATYVHSHALKAIQIGKRRRFRAEDVLDFLDQRPTNGRNRK